LSDALAQLAGNWFVMVLRRDDELLRTLPDTEITIVFGDDGSLVGSGGCNVYRTGYTAEGGTIEITRPFSTRKACLQPEGVMEQEAAYLEVLPRARRYRLDGRTLHLLSAEGAIVAEMVRVG
jgi:heat shock protein HslJ